MHVNSSVSVLVYQRHLSTYMYLCGCLFNRMKRIAEQVVEVGKF